MVHVASEDSEDRYHQVLSDEVHFHPVTKGRWLKWGVALVGGCSLVFLFVAATSTSNHILDSNGIAQSTQLIATSPSLYSQWIGKSSTPAVRVAAAHPATPGPFRPVHGKMYREKGSQ